MSGTRSSGVFTEALAPLAAGGEWSGAVMAVADRDEVLCLEAAGHADIEARRPMAEDSFFWIASTTKPFTGTAAMMLVDEGRLRLDDPVSRYYPEFEHHLRVAAYRDPADGTTLLRKPSRMPTVRECLCHTAGWPFLSVVMERNGIDSLPMPEAMTTFMLTPLNREPGTGYEYSNLDMNVVAGIIERVGGMAYAEFLQRRIFDPLELRDITFWPTAEQLGRLAVAYRTGPDGSPERQPLLFVTPPYDDRAGRFAEAGGGLFASTGDVVRFFQMLYAGGVWRGKRLLSEEAVREMRTRQTGEGMEAYGLGVKPDDVNHTWGHGGAFGNNAFVDERRGVVVVYMTQARELASHGAALGCFSEALDRAFPAGPV